MEVNALPFCAITVQAPQKARGARFRFLALQVVDRLDCDSQGLLEAVTAL